MDFVFKPTLQHMCLAKIAIELYNQDYFSGIRARNLPLPNQLKASLSGYIGHISLQMRQWFTYLWKTYYIRKSNPRELRWTSKGTIDARKSLEILLLDQSINVKRRFQLACEFCLEEHIHALWRQMSFHERTLQDDIEKLMGFWSYQLSNNSFRLQEIAQRRYKNSVTSIQQYGFATAVFHHNTAAAKYFYAHLNSPQLQQWVLSIVENKLCSNLFFPIDEEMFSLSMADLVCLLLSNMSESQQMEMLKTHPVRVLTYFLLWPNQVFFHPTVERMWKFISPADFRSLLLGVFRKVKHGVKDSVYREIFHQFWQSIPIEYRKYVINPRVGAWNMLNELFDAGEEEICRVFLKDANASSDIYCGTIQLNVRICVFNQ